MLDKIVQQGFDYIRLFRGVPEVSRFEKYYLHENIELDRHINEAPLPQRDRFTVDSQETWDSFALESICTGQRLMRGQET